MACKTKICLLHLLLATCYMQQCVNGNSPQVPCLFVFGDDLSDSGNNNNLPTIAKANYNPYGIDYPEGPTGRVTNGKTQVDIIGELLGFEKSIPPFANTSGSNILEGVNYASSSAGIRNETGKQTVGTNIALGQQIENHKTIIAQIATILGGVQQATEYLKKCLYYFNIGTNDYSLNYFQPNLYSSSSTYNPEEYAQILADDVSFYGEALYDLGARKVAVIGLGKIGCTPMVLATRQVNGPCDENLNDIEAIFSRKLKSQVAQFDTTHPDTKTIFINTTAISLAGFGFKNFNTSCCPMKSDGYCIPDSTPCLNRSEYVFYDGSRTTLAVNKIVASISYDSANNSDITYPIDIKHLANLLI